MKTYYGHQSVLNFIPKRWPWPGIDVQSRESYKTEVQRPAGSKNRVEKNAQTDGRTDVADYFTLSSNVVCNRNQKALLHHLHGGSSWQYMLSIRPTHSLWASSNRQKMIFACLIHYVMSDRWRSYRQKYSGLVFLTQSVVCLLSPKTTNLKLLITVTV